MESMLNQASQGSVFDTSNSSIFDMSSHTNIRGLNFGNDSIVDRMRGVEGRGLFNTKQITLTDQYADSSLDQRFGGGKHNVTISDIYKDKNRYNQFHGLNTDGKIDSDRSSYQIDAGHNIKPEEDGNKDFLGIKADSTIGSRVNTLMKNNTILPPSIEKSQLLSNNNVSLSKEGYNNASLNNGIYDNVSLNNNQDSSNASLNEKAHGNSIYFQQDKKKGKKEESAENIDITKMSSGIEIEDSPWKKENNENNENNDESVSKKEEKTNYKGKGYNYSKEAYKIKEKKINNDTSIKEDSNSIPKGIEKPIKTNSTEEDTNVLKNFNTNFLDDNLEIEEIDLNSLKLRLDELKIKLENDNLSDNEIKIIKENIKIIKREIIKRSFR